MVNSGASFGKLLIDLVLQNKKKRLTKKLAFTKPIFLNASQVPCQTTVLELF